MRAGLGILVALASGWALAAAAWPAGWRQPGDLLTRGALAVGLGLGVAGSAFFVAALAGWPSVGGALAGDAVLLAGGLALWRGSAARRRRAALAATPGDGPATAGAWMDWVLAGALLLVLLAAAATFWLKTARFPHGDWDAWAIWNLRARFLHRGGAAWRDGFSPWLGWSHPDYPVLLSGAVARLWHWAGRESRAVPAVVAALFTAATVAFLGGAVARLRGRRQGLVAVLLLAGTPILAVHGASQYADIALAFAFLAALALLALADQARADGAADTGLLALAGLAAGLAAWTKNEGSLLALAVVAGWLVTRLGADGWRGLARGWPLLAGLVPPGLVGLAFRLTLAPPSEMVAPLALGTVLSRAADPARLAQVGGTLAGELVGFGGGVVAAPVVGAVYLALVGPGIAPAHRAAAARTALALGLAVAGFFLVFLLLTPYDLGWHLGTSLWRVLYQLWPATVLLLALVAAPPEL